MSLQTLVENAQWEGEVLVVLDGLKADGDYGVRVELEPATRPYDGWTALARDEAGRRWRAWSPTRLGATTMAINGYLDQIIGS